MPKTPQSGPEAAENVTVPFERVERLVRQLTHDIRNGLNTLDLQTAFLQELVTDGEAAPEVKNLRAMIAGTAKMLQALSSGFWLSEPNLVTYSAKIFVEDFRARLAVLLPEQASQIIWSEALGDEAISVDLEMIFRGFSEFFKNAFHFHQKGRSIAAHAAVAAGQFVLLIREGKSSLPSPPETWGREPLESTRRGGYGMGLFQARRILAVHDGQVSFVFDPIAELLTTRLSLPLAITPA